MDGGDSGGKSKRFSVGRVTAVPTAEDSSEAGFVSEYKENYGSTTSHAEKVYFFFKELKRCPPKASA